MMDIESSTQTVMPLPSGTVDPTSHSGPNLAWLAAPAVVFALLLALSCGIIVCIVARRLNHKNARIRPQIINPQFFDPSFAAEVDDHKLPGNTTTVDTRVESHIQIELGHLFHQQNGTCKRNDQTTGEDCHNCDEADREDTSIGETVFRQLKVQESLEDSAISEEEHASYTQCTNSHPPHAQDPPSLVDSGLHLQECEDGHTEQESELPLPAGYYAACSKQPALSQDGPAEGGNSEWTFDVVQDMAALTQYMSQGEHDVFVFREESRLPLLEQVPPLPAIEEYHIGGGQQKQGFHHAHRLVNGVQ